MSIFNWAEGTKELVNTYTALTTISGKNEHDVSLYWH